MAGVVTVHAGAAPFSTSISERPEASPLARRQAAQGEKVSTLDHRLLTISDEPTRNLLKLLDGSRNVAEVARALAMEESWCRSSVQA